MRIALVIFRADPNLGGAERYAVDLGRQLKARGHDVSVLASRFGDVAPLKPVTIDCRGVTRTGRYRRFLREVGHHLHATRYDIVHAFLPVEQCDVYHAQAGIETLSLAQGHALKRTAVNRLSARLLTPLDRKRQAFAKVERGLIEGPRPPITICLSQRERGQAIATFKTPSDRIVALYNGIDTSRFETDDLDRRRKQMRKHIGIAADGRVLLFVGNDFARKGLDTAIRALSKLNDEKASLVVVGSDEPQRYTQLAARVGVLGRVMFAGHSDRVAEFLAAADALVLPSRFEPFGMVVVEAMLMGVPPIVSRACGASEVINDGIDGIVVESASDVAGWSAAIARVLTRAVHDAMANACLARREGFGYDAHLRDVEAIYAKVRR